MENDTLEELQRARTLAMSLAKEVDVKNQRLWELERKYDETSATLGRMIAEKDRLHQAFADGISCSLRLLEVVVWAKGCINFIAFLFLLLWHFLFY